MTTLRPLACPVYVQQEFYDYLRCGILAHGFLRLGCDTCTQELLVPFSCKRRGFCPSCAGRRMAQMAAMGQPETQVSALCTELGITRQTLYRHVSPQGEVRPDGRKLLGAAEGLRRGERRTVPWQSHRDSPALR